MPIGFDVWNMQDNIDISLWKLNSKKTHYSYVSESASTGITDEYIFAFCLQVSIY